MQVISDPDSDYDLADLTAAENVTLPRQSSWRTRHLKLPPKGKSR